MNVIEEMEKRGLTKDYYLVQQVNPLDNFFAVNHQHIHIMKKVSKLKVNLPNTNKTLPQKLKSSIKFLVSSINTMFVFQKKVVDIEVFEGFIKKLEVKDSNFNFLISQ